MFPSLGVVVFEHRQHYARTARSGTDEGPAHFATVAPGMGDLFDIQTLFPQLVLAIGAALAGGNGFALYQARRGRRPRGEQGQIRTARAWFLLVVGVLMAVWGLASLLT